MSEPTDRTPCPTCRHQMSMLGCRVTAMPLYFCVQCGTLKPCDSESFRPSLISLLELFEKQLTTHPDDIITRRLLKAWNQLGIGSILHPLQEAVACPGSLTKSFSTASSVSGTSSVSSPGSAGS